MPLCLLIAVLLGACAAEHPKNATPASRPGTGTLTRQVAQGTALMRAHRYAQADALFSSLLAADTFVRLDPAQQHLVLQSAGAAAFRTRDPQRSLSLLRRACDMPQTDGTDWYLRVYAANAADDLRDAGQSLTRIARRWPQVLPQLEYQRELEGAMNGLEHFGSDEDRYAVLVALHKVPLKTDPAGASAWWRDLALLQLDRGEPAAAVQTLARVNDPYVAVSVEVDKRFDSIRGEIGSRLDVEAITRQSIESARQRAQDNLNKLKPLNRLTRLLEHTLRYQQALQLTEIAIDRQEAQGPQVYSDYAEEYAWTLNRRADELYGLGRWDAAVAQLESASAMLEQAGPNASQVVNLAGIYAELGRPQQALATLQKLLPGSMSAFGDMLAEKIRLTAALQLHDETSAAAAIGFLRQHCDDALSVYQEALLMADRQDEGATLLISRLDDPRLRSDALVAVQQYGDGISPPLRVQKHERWRALVARPDVQEEISRAGAVRQYRLEYPDY
jgi:tetratricopeptide (TPR) repeat protein